MSSGLDERRAKKFGKFSVWKNGWRLSRLTFRFPGTEQNLLSNEEKHFPKQCGPAARVYVDRTARRHRDYCHPGRYAVLSARESQGSGAPDIVREQHSSARSFLHDVRR